MEQVEKYECRPITPAIIDAVLMMAVAGVVGLGVILFLSPPTAWQSDMAVPVAGLDLWVKISSVGMQQAFTQDDLWREIAPRLAACAIAMAVSARLAYQARLRVTPIVDRREHCAGNQLLRGTLATKAANSVTAREAQRGEPSITFAPGARLAREREVRNVLVCGAIGSGKTRIIMFFIERLLERLVYDPKGDHGIFIHDTTGELYEGLPLPSGSFAALHPHRPGGYAWHIGADLVEDSDCETAADQAIARTDDAVWGKGGSTMYAGCMITAKAEHGTEWGAPELYEICLRDPAALKDAFERYYPAAAKLIEFDSNGELSKTTIGFLLTFRASILRALRPLAVAWADTPQRRLFSFAAWVAGTRPEQPKVVVVQRSGRHPDISANWIGMVMETITSAVGDPRFPNSLSRTRSFVLDEAPALRRLRRWDELLDTGRNRGVATYAAIQDWAQFRRLYRDHADSIFERFATKIICAQSHGPESQRLAEKEIGKREIYDAEVTNTVQRGPNGRTETAATTKRSKDVLIVRPEHLVQRLGIFDRKVRALVVGFGNVLELEWPIMTWIKRR